jgi:hypothetical protein
MSKGLSWRQRWMIDSIAREATRWGKNERNKPVAWRAIDYGPTDEEVYFTARGQWNIEQALRRSLRSLERRGLVELGRYCFRPDADMYRGGSPEIFWSYVHPDDYVPGEMRTMTGVTLTDAGWALARKAKDSPR